MIDFYNLCRRLANRERINLLRLVTTASEPEGLPMGCLADLAGMKLSAACQYLAQLEVECGLLESSRCGRHVHYRVARQPFDPKVATLLPALVEFYRREREDADTCERTHYPDPPFRALMPSLGNTNRVRVLSAIRTMGDATATDLQRACHLSEANVRRHLSILSASDLVARSAHGYVFRTPRESLSERFVRLAVGATAGEQEPSAYFVR